MGYMIIKYEDALKHHPHETTKVIANFRKSKWKGASKYTPQTLTWGYRYCRRFDEDSYKGQDINLEFEDWKTSTFNFRLTAKCEGHGGWSTNIINDSVPDLACQQHLKTLQAYAANMAKLNTMSHEERVELIEETLSKCVDSSDLLLIGTRE